MSVRKLNAKTKDERSWVFECRYKNYEGNIKQYTSRRFHTKIQHYIIIRKKLNILKILKRLNYMKLQHQLITIGEIV